MNLHQWKGHYRARKMIQYSLGMVHSEDRRRSD